MKRKLEYGLVVLGVICWCILCLYLLTMNFSTSDKTTIGELRGYPHQENPFLYHDTIYEVVAIKGNYIEYMNVKDGTIKSNKIVDFLSVTDKIDMLDNGTDWYYIDGGNKVIIKE